MPGNIVSISPEELAKWPKPNYVDPVERNWMPVYSGVLYGFATLMVATRIVLRISNQAGRIGLDDVLLGIAWLVGSFFTVVINLATNVNNANRHAWDVPQSSYVDIALMTWLAEMSFLITGGCTKISVLMFYRRLVAGTYSKRSRWAVWTAITFTAGYSIAFILTLIFNCTPTAAYWEAFDPSYNKDYDCVDTTIVNLLAGIFAVASDLYSVVLPCLLTLSLDLPKAQKVALNVIFSLALIVVASSSVRTYYLYEVGHQSDFTWYLFSVFVWAQLELQLGIMCACAPSIRVLFRRFLGSRTLRETSTAMSKREYNATGYTDLERPKADIPAHGPAHSTYPATSAPNDSKGFHSGDCQELSANFSRPTRPPRPDDDYVVRTPAEYEMYNLQAMEKYRRSLGSPRQQHHLS